jgi:hypothetical protein
VILVSYRHGQGWLVAEDPRTGESGLVPEDFVRLLRDIEGGLTGLNEEPTNSSLSADSSSNVVAPDSTYTPTQSDPEPDFLPPCQPSAQTLHLINGSPNTDNNDTDTNPPLNPSAVDNSKEKPKDKEKEKHPPVVSTFSTSSRDLDPYPPHLLGGKSNPPQIEHYDGTTGGNGSKASSIKPRNISKQPAARSGSRPGSGTYAKP